MKVARRLRDLAERRLPALTRLRRRETLPITLHRRRIYIVPTGFGIGFAVLLMVMLVGALNYANNAALLLTCLLGGAAVNSMLLTFRALDGVTLEQLDADPVTAGQMLTLRLRWRGAGRRHGGLLLGDDLGTPPVPLPLSAEATATVSLPCLGERRGWMPVPRLRLSSNWPFGLFRAWSWLAPDTLVLVYPTAEAHGPPPRAPGEDVGARRQQHGDDVAGLRDYRPGDPRKHVAWKASARHLSLLVREHETAAPQPAPVLDWDSLRGLDAERRIARLARWVGEARDADTSWTLRLPDVSHGPDRGEAHYHRCLRALAELP